MSMKKLNKKRLSERLLPIGILVGIGLLLVWKDKPRWFIVLAILVWGAFFIVNIMILLGLFFRNAKTGEKWFAGSFLALLAIAGLYFIAMP